MIRGRVYSCRISDITGGGDLSLGVNIELTAGEFIEPVWTAEPPVTPSSMFWQLQSRLGLDFSSRL